MHFLVGYSGNYENTSNNYYEYEGIIKAENFRNELKKYMYEAIKGYGKVQFSAAYETNDVIESSPQISSDMIVKFVTKQSKRDG